MLALGVGLLGNHLLEVAELDVVEGLVLLVDGVAYLFNGQALKDGVVGQVLVSLLLERFKALVSLGRLGPMLRAMGLQ